MHKKCIISSSRVFALKEAEKWYRSYKGLLDQGVNISIIISIKSNTNQFYKSSRREKIDIWEMM